jgi:hypothetical protein
MKLVSAFLLTAACGFAQWTAFPTQGPRTADGKIDMAGTPPRLANDKPDFSGLWEMATGTFNGTPALPFPVPTADGDPPEAQFFNIGGRIKEGLPFTPWAIETRAKRKADNAKDNPDALCLPLGLTQLHMHIQPRKIVQTTREIVVMYEANGNTRQILTDGRKLPTNNPTPWWYGYSVGHWDGDALVVETTGFRDDVWLDVEGSPLTSTGKMTERWTRPKFGLMQVDITIEDPKAYTKPFTVRVSHRLMADTELMEFVCEERDAIHYVGASNTK